MYMFDIVYYYSYLLRYLHISASISVALLVLTNQATVIVCVIQNVERMPQTKLILVYQHHHLVFRNYRTQGLTKTCWKSLSLSHIISFWCEHQKCISVKPVVKQKE